MVSDAKASVNVDHQSYFTPTDNDELLVGWDRRALSSEVVEVGEGVLVILSAFQYVDEER